MLFGCSTKDKNKKKIKVLNYIYKELWEKAMQNYYINSEFLLQRYKE